MAGGAGGRPALERNVGRYTVSMYLVPLGASAQVYYPKPEDWKPGDKRKATHFQAVVQEQLLAGEIRAVPPTQPSESHPFFKDAHGRPFAKLLCLTKASYKLVLRSSVSRCNEEAAKTGSGRAMTTEKSFCKNLRTFGLKLDEKEKSFTFDLARWNSLCYRVVSGGVSTVGSNPSMMRMTSSPIIGGIQVEQPPSFYLEFGRTVTPNGPGMTQQEILHGKESWKCSPRVEVPGFGTRRVSFVLAPNPASRVSPAPPTIKPCNTAHAPATSETITSQGVHQSKYKKELQQTPGVTPATANRKRARNSYDEDADYEETFLADRQRILLESLRREEIDCKIFGMFYDDPTQEQQQEMASFIESNRRQMDRSVDFLDLELVERTLASGKLIIKQEMEILPSRVLQEERCRDRNVRAKRAHDGILEAQRSMPNMSVRDPTTELFAEAERDIWHTSGCLLSAGIVE